MALLILVDPSAEALSQAVSFYHQLRRQRYIEWSSWYQDGLLNGIKDAPIDNQSVTFDLT